MNRLKLLLERCENSVNITVNKHRDYNQTVEQAFDQLMLLNDGLYDEIEQETMQKMIDIDTIIEIIFYPDTSVGSYHVYHYDIDNAIEECLECLKL